MSFEDNHPFFDSYGEQLPPDPFMSALPSDPFLGESLPPVLPLPPGYEPAVPLSTEQKAEQLSREAREKRARWEQPDVAVREVSEDDLALLALSSGVPRGENVSELTYRHQALAAYYPNGYDLRTTDKPGVFRLLSKPV